MFLFWVNGLHSVKVTWSSFGWRRSESRAGILLLIGQSVFCCKRHWTSQELSKQEAPSWGIKPGCLHTRQGQGQPKGQGRGGGDWVCLCKRVLCEWPAVRKVLHERRDIAAESSFIIILQWWWLLMELNADLITLEYVSINHKKHLIWFSLWWN